jgi:hypothetical protein
MSINTSSGEFLSIISSSSNNQTSFAKSTSTNTQIQKLNERFQSLMKRNASPQPELQKLKEVTRFIGVDGKVISDAELSQRISRRIEGIYSADSVTVNTVPFTLAGVYEVVNGVRKEKVIDARKIEIKRTWCLYDMVPLGVFLPTLCKNDSVYRKTIQTSTIRDFLLDAKLTEGDIDEIFNDAKAVLSQTNDFTDCSEEDFSSFGAVIRKKHHLEAPLEFTQEDGTGHSEIYNNRLTTFLNKFNELFNVRLEEGKKQLHIAFWKSKSLTIYLPIQLYDPVEQRQLGAYIEAPKDAGFATRLAINLATILRSTKQEEYRLLEDQ